MRRPPLRRAWTEEEDDLLHRMLSEGKSRAVAAIRLKRSVSAVDSRLKLLRKAVDATLEVDDGKNLEPP